MSLLLFMMRIYTFPPRKRMIFSLSASREVAELAEKAL